MAGKKFLRKDDIFQIVNKVGTRIGKQYPCQHRLNFDIFFSFRKIELYLMLADSIS